MAMPEDGISVTSPQSLVTSPQSLPKEGRYDKLLLHFVAAALFRVA